MVCHRETASAREENSIKSQIGLVVSTFNGNVKNKPTIYVVNESASEELICVFR